MQLKQWETLYKNENKDKTYDWEFAGVNFKCNPFWYTVTGKTIVHFYEPNELNYKKDQLVTVLNPTGNGFYECKIMIDSGDINGNIHANHLKLYNPDSKENEYVMQNNDIAVVLNDVECEGIGTNEKDTIKQDTKVRIIDTMFEADCEHYWVLCSRLHESDFDLEQFYVPYFELERTFYTHSVVKAMDDFEDDSDVVYMHLKKDNLYVILSEIDDEGWVGVVEYNTDHDKLLQEIDKKGSNPPLAPANYLMISRKEDNEFRTLRNRHSGGDKNTESVHYALPSDDDEDEEEEEEVPFTRYK
jgi:phenylpyruvate tautomerase PptA (4-oxalocrotonate tautomerase family)